MIDPHAATLAYLEYVLQSVRMTPTALAKKIGISSTTLTRPLNSPHHKYTISTSTISKIAKFSGINPGPFFDGSDVATRHIEATNDRNNAIDMRNPSSKAVAMFKSLLPIVGEINVSGAPILDEVVGPEFYDVIFLTNTSRNQEDVFGIAITGNGANKIAQPGEILVCAKRSEIGKYRKEGVIFVLQHYTDDGMFVEIGAYIMQKSADGSCWELQPATKEEDSRPPIPLSDETLDPEHLRVIGIVDYVVRKPTMIK
ncbi:MAG: helix-turn-helix transcriptional regulator [Methylobacterium sp.]|uniref:helix-turn-helix domain-containing protein n=1 Tax=Methylobacterium sp. TaxID=409 RepID=UPI00271F1F74|nr:helix-turn-helix transcriptional regulator [Methylobacterium sp.]MDO9428410.1 helix-turn-helix transcriptional regulator [Methylobacterium sp.]